MKNNYNAFTKNTIVIIFSNRLKEKRCGTPLWGPVLFGGHVGAEPSYRIVRVTFRAVALIPIYHTIYK